MVTGCQAVVQGSTEDEVLQKVAEYARTEHQMSEVSPELAETVRSRITEA